MFELDKVRFGAFAAELRKEKGLTQKEVAQKLYVSDKAVSKWERGASVPDAALLVPLAELLDVTVTELLEGRRMEKEAPMDVRQADEVVRKVIGLSAEKRQKLLPGKPRRMAELAVCALICGVEIAGLNGLVHDPGEMYSMLGVHVLLYLLLGAVFNLFVRERLPDYYDSNRISSYNGGWIRMNIPGVYINNNNWPYIILGVRLWSMVGLIVMPLLYYAGSVLIPGQWSLTGRYILLIISLSGLFIPCYVLGRKYE